MHKQGQIHWLAPSYTISTRNAQRILQILSIVTLILTGIGLGILPNGVLLPKAPNHRPYHNLMCTHLYIVLRLAPIGPEVPRCHGLPYFACLYGRLLVQTTTD